MERTEVDIHPHSADPAWRRRAIGPGQSHPDHLTVLSLFSAQVARRGELTAIIFGDRRVSYLELDARANQIARRLRAAGVGAESLVGLLAHRSIECVAAMLGILRAGGAFLPLDASSPAERLALILDDARPAILLCEDSLRDRLPHFSGEILPIDFGDAASPEVPAPPLTADDIAYVMYTSGSTGRPKGVAVPHRGIVRLLIDTNYCTLSENDRVYHGMSVAFDGSTFEIWAPLLHGGTLVIGPERPTLAELAEVVKRHRVTVLLLSTGLFHLVVDNDPGALDGVRQLLAGGDVMARRRAQAALSTLSCTLVNGYGPTESTTFATCHVMKPGATIDTSVPIGLPIANTRVYVLDKELTPVPPDAIGELYIAGDGLARGYWRRPDLTAERFVPDPLGPPGSRMYRTGDLGTQSEDGVIRFHGRCDAQVKIRGFRVELEEVEAALESEPAVSHAAVLAVTSDQGDKQLVAFVAAVSGECEVTPSGIRAALAARLPDYMIPARVVLLTELPVTEHGKVDRLELASLAAEPAFTAVAAVSNHDPLLTAVISVFKEVFGQRDIDSDGSFYELGGDSLRAMQLCARLRDIFAVEIPLRLVLENGIVRDLARAVGTTVSPQRS